MIFLQISSCPRISSKRFCIATAIARDVKGQDVTVYGLQAHFHSQTSKWEVVSLGVGWLLSRNTRSSNRSVVILDNKGSNKETGVKLGNRQSRDQ